MGKNPGYRSGALFNHSSSNVELSDAGSGWAGCALAHQEFGSSVNPITTRGPDYTHHITASPPGFENPVASLYNVFTVPLGEQISVEFKNSDCNLD